MKSNAFLIVNMIIGLTLLVSCSEAPDASTQKQSLQIQHDNRQNHKRIHTKTQEILAETQVFTYASLQAHSSLDPQIPSNDASMHLTRNLFEGLFNQDSDGHLVAALAEHYEVSEDRTQYTFSLRQGARWSNGTPITADDFVYAWQRAVSASSHSSSRTFFQKMPIKNSQAILLGNAEPSTLGISALDTHTLLVELESPLPYFTRMLSHPHTFPLPKEIVNKFGKDWTNPENIVSNGAYKLARYVINEHYELERNPLYWDNKHTYIDKVINLIIPNATRRLEYWEQNQLDFIPSLPNDQLQQLKKQYPIEAISIPNLCTFFYQINQDINTPNVALRDVRVRTALSYAIDRNLIVETQQHSAQAAYTLTPEATNNFKRPAIGYNLITQEQREEQARELFKQAGYAHGLEVTLNYSNSDQKTIATLIANMWQSTLGVTTTLNEVDAQTVATQMKEGRFEIMSTQWCGQYNEASAFLNLMHSDNPNNYGHYKSLEIDKLLELSMKEDDPQQVYERIEQILAEDMAIIPMYHNNQSFLLHKNIKGWPINNVEQFWYAKNLYRVSP